jgi:hypothetical protein
MKNKYIICMMMIVPLIGLTGCNKSEIFNAVNEKCSQYENGDDWAGCVIELSLDKNDAKYCKSESIFSPYPGICMEHFAQKTKNKESCGTITKPKYIKMCLNRFN